MIKYKYFFISVDTKYKLEAAVSGVIHTLHCGI